MRVCLYILARENHFRFICISTLDSSFVGVVRSHVARASCISAAVTELHVILFYAATVLGQLVLTQALNLAHAAT